MKQPGLYNGHKKALTIALDVGTTFSGVSYVVLDPGEIPKIYKVTRYAPRVPSPPHFFCYSKRCLSLPSALPF